MEEFAEVLDRGIPEHLRLAVIGAGQPIGQMADQLRQFVDERLLGQFDRFVKPRLDPLAFLLVQAGIQLREVRRRLDAGEFPRDGELGLQTRRIIGGIEEFAEAAPGGPPQFGILLV